MPGLVPGIHVFSGKKTWMAGTSPAMTSTARRHIENHAFQAQWISL
jgi:hypothetical protein